MSLPSKSNSTEPTFGFRVKFHLPPGRTFAHVHPQRRLHFGLREGRIYLLRLPLPKRHRFGARTKHCILGTGFPTYEIAEDVGRNVKKSLTLFAAERRVGLDAGTDQSTSSLSQAIKDAMFEQQRVALRDDIHGLDVFSEEHPVTRFAFEGYGSSTYVIGDYEDRLVEFFQADVSFTPKQQLALDLYNQSHFESVSKTRFLTLITVVEILATPKRRSQQLATLVRNLCDTARQSDPPPLEIDALLEGLARLRKQSIGEACRNFVGTYSSLDDVAFFSNCYKARSELVHGGRTKRPEAIDATALDELVSKLLVRSLTRAASVGSHTAERQKTASALPALRAL